MSGLCPGDIFGTIQPFVTKLGMFVLHCDVECHEEKWVAIFKFKVTMRALYIYIYIYDLVPKGVHENRTKGVENKVDDTLKLVVFLECEQC